jgi:hypothetical protein
VTERDFLTPAKTMPMRFIVELLRVTTANSTYDGSITTTYTVSYDPPGVVLNPGGISDAGGGFGMTGAVYPLPMVISRRLLLQGQNHDYDHDPALTMTMPDPPQSCEVVVRDGFTSENDTFPLTLTK